MQKIAFACSTLFILSASKELPSFIEKCKLIEEEDVGECIKDRINVLKPRLVNGIPEMKLPSIDPLHIPKMEIHTGSGSGVAFDAVVTKMDVFGGKDTEVVEVRLNLKTRTGLLHLKFPNLYVVGTYSIKGKVLLFDLQTKGPMTGNITDIDATTKFGFDVVEKNGQKYIKMKSTDIEVSNSFKNAVMRFDNLFDNQELNNQINIALNENVQELAKEVGPLVHDATHLLVVGVLNPVFNDYSIDELFIRS
ncbi:hypothetical protein FQR65_LT12351 [Abscondita terminalis]|nr:hypothetical protein FQR65_LT12351 [Abscondita terminalis]